MTVLLLFCIQGLMTGTVLASEDASIPVKGVFKKNSILEEENKENLKTIIIEVNNRNVRKSLRKLLPRTGEYKSDHSLFLVLGVFFTNVSLLGMTQCIRRRK
ncbi:hypothetical protein E0T50_000444 [Enterococcus faecalis]|nr:hypothetical protein [Enterococcus faecalis]EIP8069463.1 hypothetical protein [Enterococcus faecalis]